MWLPIVLLFAWSSHAAVDATTEMVGHHDIVRLACAAHFCHGDNPFFQERLAALTADDRLINGPGMRWSRENQRAVTCYNLCTNDAESEELLGVLGLTAEDVKPPKKWLKRARDAVSDYQNRSVDCVANWDSIVHVVAEPFQTLSSRVYRALKRCGVCLLTGLFTDDAKRTELQARFAFPDAYTRLMKMQANQKTFQIRSRIEGGDGERETQDVLIPTEKEFLLDVIGDFLSSPPLLKAVSDYFDTNSKKKIIKAKPGGMRLSYASFVAAPPADAADTEFVDDHVEAQHTHADLSTPGLSVSAQLALHDITEERGPTAYCPATHMVPDLDLMRIIRGGMMEKSKKGVPDICKSRTAVVPQGTVILYDSALLHSGSPNKMEHTRALLNVNLGAGKQALYEENYVQHFIPQRNGSQKLRQAQEEVLDQMGWMRTMFNYTFYRDLLANFTCDVSSTDVVNDTAHDGALVRSFLRDDDKDGESKACSFSPWSLRRAALLQRMESFPPPMSSEPEPDDPNANMYILLFCGVVLLMNSGIKWMFPMFEKNSLGEFVRGSMSDKPEVDKTKKAKSEKKKS